MKTIKTTLNKIINFFKSFFKKKVNKPEPQSEEPVKSEIKRLVYTKRTDQ
jgi:hypothetical protein